MPSSIHRPGSLIEGLTTERGNFHAESTHSDLHRLWMSWVGEALPWIMRVTASGKRYMILFGANPRLLAMLADGVETSPAQIVTSLPPEDLATGGNITIGRELAPPSFMHHHAPPRHAPGRGC